MKAFLPTSKIIFSSLQQFLHKNYFHFYTFRKKAIFVFNPQPIYMSLRIVPYLVIAFLILFCSNAEAQKFRRFKSQYQKRMYHHGEFSFTAGAGISSYFGDLKDNSLHLWAKPSIQLGTQYRVNNNLHIRSEIMWYRIGGADSLNDLESPIRTRNLSFRSDNAELSAVALWQYFNKFSRYNRPILNPYAFAGIALTTYNPKGFYQGKWHELRPLQTEGKQYGFLTLALPVGLGITYHLDPKWDISAEYGYRITFNDYLDDVSGAYLGIDAFPDGSVAQALSDRRPELGLEPKSAGFPKRGNSTVDDWYLITGLKVTYSPGPKARKKYRRPKYK